MLRCKENTGDFPLLVLPSDPAIEISDGNFVASSEYSINNGYNLTIGKQYRVYGILAGAFALRYLIVGDDCIPNYYPAELFDICDGNVCMDWQMAQYQIAGLGVLLTVGFSVTEGGYDVLRDLVDGKSSSIASFLQYKSRVEYWDI